MEATTAVALINTGKWITCLAFLYAAYKMPDFRGWLIFISSLVGLLGGSDLKHSDDSYPNCEHKIESLKEEEK